MDGVLVDSSDAHFAAWQRLGTEVGQTFSREMFEATFGMHNGQIIPMWLGPDLTHDAASELSVRKETYYREEAHGRVHAIEGVVELARALHEGGFALAVGSSGPEPNVKMVLELLGLAPLFAALSTAEDVTNGKPHPEVFEIAARKLDLPPGRCVVFEDATMGVEAGLAAGCKVLAITTTRPASELTNAHRVVESFSNLSAAEVRALVDR